MYLIVLFLDSSIHWFCLRALRVLCGLMNGRRQGLKKALLFKLEGFLLYGSGARIRT